MVANNGQKEFKNKENVVAKNGQENNDNSWGITLLEEVLAKMYHHCRVLGESKVRHIS